MKHFSLQLWFAFLASLCLASLLFSPAPAQAHTPLRQKDNAVPLSDLVKFAYQYHAQELVQERELEETDGGGTEFVTDTETETVTEEITDPDLLPAECGDVVLCFFNWSTSQCPSSMSELCCEMLANYLEYNCSNRIGLSCPGEPHTSPADYFVRTCAISVEMSTRLDMARQDFDIRVERAFRRTVADQVGVDLSRVTVTSVTDATPRKKSQVRFKQNDETLVQSITKVDTQEAAARAERILSDSQAFLNALNFNLGRENSTVVLTRVLNTVNLRNNTHVDYNDTSISFSFSASPSPGSAPTASESALPAEPGSKQTGSASQVSAVAAVLFACTIVLLL